MRILIADKFPQHWMDVLTKQGHQVTYQPGLDENTIPQNISNNEVLIVRSTKVTVQVMDAGKDLKLIIRAGAGYNTIDVEYAKKKGLPVCNCPGTNSLAVAELTMALMLALDRRIFHNVRDLREGKWNKNEYSKAKGIAGRTLGIIGLGNIGKAVAKRAQAFDMKVVAYDPYDKPELFTNLGILPEPDIYELARISDIVTVHLPETPETKGMFNKKFFDEMKPASTFINTSRGSLVNTKDLVAAAQAKDLRVGLDVYECEPKAADNVFDYSCFQGCGNLYGTHHIGASTDQAQDAVAETAVKIINEFVSTKELLHRVN